MLIDDEKKSYLVLERPNSLQWIEVESSILFFKAQFEAEFRLWNAWKLFLKMSLAVIAAMLAVNFRLQASQGNESVER